MSFRSPELERPAAWTPVPRAWTRACGQGAVALGLVWLAAAPAEAASFRGLAETASYAKPSVAAVNANGDQIVGESELVAGSPPKGVATVWDEETHALSITGPSAAGTRRTRATGQETSSDGLVRRTLGYTEYSGGLPSETWIRVEDAVAATDTTTVLAPHPSPTASNEGRAISRHGHRLAEYVDGGPTISYFYDPGTGTNTDIPNLIAEDMDAEGRRVVGTGTATPGVFRAMLWEAATGTALDLGTLPGGGDAFARAISPNGRIVVGSSESGNLNPPLREAFRWHSDFGMQPLTPIPPGESYEGEALASSDANIVVGRYRHASGDFRAFIWTPGPGRRDLKDWVEATYGLDLSGWTLREARAVSADGLVIAGNGINPDTLAQDWVLDLRPDNRAVIRVRPVQIPTSYSLHLECGDVALASVAFGLIPSQAFLYDGSFDFADCTNPISVGGQQALDCTGATGIGPNISSDSYVYLPQEADDVPVENVQEAAFYFRIEGIGGEAGNLLCEPGDPELLIGSFDLDQPYGDLHPVTSPYQFAIGQTGSGDYVGDEEFRLLREREPGGVFLDARPEVDDPDGVHWTVTLDAPLALSKFSFGIIVPPSAGPVSFGDCNESLGGIYNARKCANGLRLGAFVDASAVRTLGPDPDLFTDFGLRPDTLYVYVEGALPGLGIDEQLNTPDALAQVGNFTFDDYLSPNPGYHPALTFERVEALAQVLSEIDDWTDLDGVDVSNVQFLSGPGVGPGPDADQDLDGLADAYDLCPYVVSTQVDGGTLEQYDGFGGIVIPAAANDNVGAECQCGEAENNAQVLLPDVEALRGALVSPELAALLDADSKRRCNSVGPVALTLDSETNLPLDCDINDIFVLMRARQGLPPLIAAPLEFPSCPDVTTP